MRLFFPLRARSLAAALMLLVLFVSACAEGTGPIDPVVTDIEIQGHAAPLKALGETRTLTGTPVNAKGQPVPDVAVTWLSVAPGVATVDATTGAVTAIANGTARINAVAADTIVASVDVVVLQKVHHLAIVQQPMPTLHHVALPPIIIEQRDSLGTVVANSALPLAIALAPDSPGGTLTGTTVVNPVAGRVTFAGLSIDQVATGYRLGIGIQGVPTVLTEPFEIMAVAVRIDSVKFGSPFVVGSGTQYRVWATNGAGRELTDVAVDGAIVQGGISLTGGAFASGCSPTPRAMLPGKCEFTFNIQIGGGSGFTAGQAEASVRLREGAVERTPWASTFVNVQ